LFGRLTHKLCFSGRLIPAPAVIEVEDMQVRRRYDATEGDE
jgi:hypothetical protein